MKSKWLVLFLIWLMLLVAYFDRINLPVAASSMMKALHLTKTQWGFVLSAFTLGYALLQAPGGHFADRFGSRRLLIFAILVWSIFTGLTGLAISLIMLVGIRVVFGFGEGLENGAQYRLVGLYFQPKERAFANSVFLSAMALGPALGTPSATWMVSNWGWQKMFFGFAILGLTVGLVLFLFLPRDVVVPAKKDDSTQDCAAGTGEFANALRRPTSWLCAGSYMLFNMAFWGFLSWVPIYLREDRHIPLAKSGVIGALPYFAGFAGMMVAGYLGSTVFSQRRSVLVAACYVASAAGLLFALSAQSTLTCMTGLCVSGFFLYAGFGPFWAVSLDLAPPHCRGVFTGSVNCCGQIGAFCSQIIIGILADQMKSFTGAILFMTCALCLSAVVMLQLHKLLRLEANISDNAS